MKLAIRKSTMEDLDRVMELFTDARIYMAENGNPNQWKTNWPPRENIIADIMAQDSYVCVDGDKIVGTFFMKKALDHTYFNIYDGEWVDDEKEYCVVHRITTDRNTRGVGTFCLNWVFEYCNNIRIDTHKDNIPMQSLLEKLGFCKCGIIHLDNGEDRIAFQKVELENA